MVSSVKFLRETARKVIEVRKSAMKRGEQVPDDILQRIIEQGLLTHAAELFYAGFAGNLIQRIVSIYSFLHSFSHSLTDSLIHSFIHSACMNSFIHLFVFNSLFLFSSFIRQYFLRLDYIVIGKLSRLLIYLNVGCADNPLLACFFFFMEF